MMYEVEDCTVCGDAAPGCYTPFLCMTCFSILKALIYHSDLEKRAKLHQVIMHIAKGVDD